MRSHPACKAVIAALVCSVVFLVSVSPARAQQSGNYFEASVGLTRPPKGEIPMLTLDPEHDVAFSLALGSSFSENTRAEAELGYAQLAWDLGSGNSISADGFNVGANLLFDFGERSSPVKFEMGIGLGWVFFDEACLEDSGVSICVDADFDDWNVQGILGVSYALSETGAIVARYRMRHIGGFSSEDRFHVFTIGYRHHF